MISLWLSGTCTPSLRAESQTRVGAAEQSETVCLIDAWVMDSLTWPDRIPPFASGGIRSGHVRLGNGIC